MLQPVTSRDPDGLNKADFGDSFVWGVAASAFQTEGSPDADGKGPSVWDVFSARKGRVRGGDHARVACDFYNRYDSDVELVRDMHIPNFRFSLCWPRIIPAGHGRLNRKGIDFYNRVIDACLSKGITPWITLYHWDLPEALESRGGWTSRDIVSWFSEYADTCSRAFGDRVKNWMVLNEPMGFVGAGYFLGLHAPGRKGLRNFLPAAHHAVLAMAEGGRILRSNVPDALIGTTFSCSLVEPLTGRPRDYEAALRADALLNRLFVEPVLGLGYPVRELPVLRRLEKYMQAGDEQRMCFDFDFTGIQNYTREVVRHSLLMPYLWAKVVPAEKRNVPVTAMNWEVYPESLYRMIRKFDRYPGIRKLLVTENGAAFPDRVNGNEVHDPQRVGYLQDYLAQVLRAKRDGCRVDGYFVWSLTDNFEWAEGYHPRFGLVYVDFRTQQRIMKSSGKWYREFLKG